MKEAYLIADNIISSLGFNTAENIAAIEKQNSGILLFEKTDLSDNPFYASIIDTEKLNCEFEKITTRIDFTGLCWNGLPFSSY